MCVSLFVGSLSHLFFLHYKIIHGIVHGIPLNHRHSLQVRCVVLIKVRCSMPAARNSPDAMPSRDNFLINVLEVKITVKFYYSYLLLVAVL